MLRRVRDGVPLPVGLVVVATIIVCAVPGVGVLDFYAALMLAPVCAWAAGAIVRRQHGLHQRTLRAWRDAVLVLVLPPLLLWLDGLRVPSCAPGTGLLLWLLGPGCSMIVGASMAAIAAALRPSAAHATWWALAAATVIAPLHAFVTGPTVASWNELLGMVPGALYEDALGPELRTLAFRATTTPLWLGLAAWAISASRVGAVGVGGLVGVLRADHLARIAALIAATAALVGAWRGGADGWRVRQGDLDGALPVRFELRLTPQSQADPTAPAEVVVHVTAAPGWRRRGRLVAEDAAVRWLELRTWIAAAPRGTVDVYVYMHDDQKQALMGARAVEMAKPWLGQAHLVDPGFGETILAHEMAHVVGASLIDGPFGVPMRSGVLPDAVRIEGFAVAAEWPDDDGLDPHDLTAAMQALALAPELDALLSPLGFATESSARAYAMAGSLLRFVAERCGPAALRAVYAGADIDAVCTSPGPAAAPTPVTAPSVRAAWQAMLDKRAAALPQAQLERLRARFASPGLLLRPCPLETGRCRERAERAWRANDSAAELEQWRALRASLLREVPAQALPLGLDLAWIAALSRSGAGDAAMESVATRLSAQPREVDRAALLSARGDLRLRSGDVAGALADWATAAHLPRSEGARRTLRIKAALAAGAAGRTAVERLYSLGALHVHTAEVLAELAASTRARWPSAESVAARYLHARRRLLGPRRSAAAAELHEVLAAAGAWPVFGPELGREVARLLALDAARNGDCAAVDQLAADAGDDAIVRHWRAAYQSRCRTMQALGPAERWLRVVERSRR